MCKLEKKEKKFFFSTCLGTDQGHVDFAIVFCLVRQGRTTRDVRVRWLLKVWPRLPLLLHLPLAPPPFIPSPTCDFFFFYFFFFLFHLLHIHLCWYGPSQFIYFFQSSQKYVLAYRRGLNQTVFKIIEPPVWEFQARRSNHMKKKMKKKKREQKNKWQSGWTLERQFYGKENRTKLLFLWTWREKWKKKKYEENTMLLCEFAFEMSWIFMVKIFLEWKKEKLFWTIFCWKK